MKFWGPSINPTFTTTKFLFYPPPPPNLAKKSCFQQNKPDLEVGQP